MAHPTAQEVAELLRQCQSSDARQTLEPAWEAWPGQTMEVEIESKLRSWVLRQCGVPLFTLSYEELRLITEGKIRDYDI